MRFTSGRAGFGEGDGKRTLPRYFTLVSVVTLKGSWRNYLP